MDIDGLTRDEYSRLLTSKFHPDRVLSTLAFAGLYQLVHEMLKTVVLDRVRGFYLSGFDESGLIYDDAAYASKVLRGQSKRKAFAASLRWLVDNDAITQEQSDRLDDIYEHRHELTHDLLKYIVDVRSEPNVELFIEALRILSDIERFWVQIEIDTGAFEEYGEVTIDDVTPGMLSVLQICIDSYVNGFPPAGPELASPSEAPPRT